MSPEQASGQPIDARSDIFSFGTVLYQLISGHLPFSGATPLHILTQILHTDPPELDSTSKPLVRIIRRCLEKDRDKRYASMSELLTDLTALKKGETGGKTRAPQSSDSGHNVCGS